LPEGQYNWRPFFYNSNDGTKSYTYQGATTWIDFNVVSNNFFADYSAATSTDAIACSLVDIAGCFQNLLHYLFVPSPQVIGNFFSLKDQLATRKPFSYFYGTKVLLDQMSVESTTTTSIMFYVKGSSFDAGQAPIISAPTGAFAGIKTWADNALVVICLLLFVDYAIHRVMHFFGSKRKQ